MHPSYQLPKISIAQTTASTASFSATGKEREAQKPHQRHCPENDKGRENKNRDMHSQHQSTIMQTPTSKPGNQRLPQI